MKNDIEATGESQNEAKQTIVLAANVERVPSLENVLDIRRFGSLCKLVRVTCFIVRLVNNLKARVKKEEMQVDILKPQEISAAENALIKAAQVRLKETTDYANLVKQLGLVEREGVLRCSSRLGNSSLAVEAREPIILPKDRWLTVLIVRACHQRVHHCGLRATLA
jgi:hypothetical protein